MVRFQILTVWLKGIQNLDFYLFRFGMVEQFETGPSQYCFSPVRTELAYRLLLKTVQLILQFFLSSLNRRRDDEGEVKTEELELDRVGLENDNDISQYYETISIHTESSNTNASKGKTSDSITRIFACATMWHETKSEMMEMLKSLFR